MTACDHFSMKIVLIGITHPFRGGIAHYTSLLARELEKKHLVELISLKKQYPRFLFPGKTQIDESRRRIETRNVPLIHPLAPWTWFSALLKIKKIAPDMVLFQWWHPFFGPSFGTLARWLKRWQRTKIVFLCHNVRPHESTAIDSLLIRYAFGASERFIVHSESDLKILKRMKPGSAVFKTPHPTYEIFRGDDTPDSLEARRRLGVRGNTLLFFGYIRRYKGLGYLLQALPQVLNVVDCTLLIVGEVYEGRTKYRKMIEDYHLEKNVKWIDRYVPNEEVPFYFRAADLVVLPYVSATQSGVIQIAYGFNRPVVSTKVGGIPEAIIDGETGFLVDPEDPEALAQAILRFYQKKETIDFSQKIEKWREAFSWGNLVRLIERIEKEF